MFDPFVFSWLCFATLGILLFVELYLLERPGSFLYRIGIPVIELQIPETDEIRWSALLSKSSRLDGKVNITRGEVYLRVRKKWFDNFNFYDPFTGLVKFPESSRLRVRMAPVASAFWVFLLLFVFVISLSKKNPADFLLVIPPLLIGVIINYLSYLRFKETVLNVLKENDSKS